MKSPLLRTLGKVSWVVTALASVSVGLCPLGYNMLHLPVLSTLAGPLHYVVGAAGVLSLVMFAMMCTCKHDGGCKC